MPTYQLTTTNLEFSLLLTERACSPTTILVFCFFVLFGIVMIQYHISTASLSGRNTLSNLVKAVELGRSAWYYRPIHLRALSLLLTVLPETAENPSGKGFTILLVTTAAGVSAFIAYLVLRNKYRPASATELPKITLSDLMDQPGPDVLFAIEQQTPAERQFFFEADQHRVRNLELIERGMQLAAQRRKQFAVLWRDNLDDQLERVHDCLMFGRPIVPVDVRMMSSGSREAFVHCMVAARLSTVARLFKSHVGVLDHTRVTPPSACGYANLTQNPDKYVPPATAPETSAVDSAEVSVTSVSADQLGFAGSCSIQLCFVLLLTLPKILERYFPNTFCVYVNCISRATRLVVTCYTKVRRIC